MVPNLSMLHLRDTTTSAYAFAKAPAARCPEHVAHVFKYYDREWKDAGRGLSFFCRGSVKIQEEVKEEEVEEEEEMGKKAEEEESA